jgi:5'-methylthioadenosine phosphorylase
VLAFLTGTGFYELPGLADRRSETISTPFGDAPVTLARWADSEIAFLARHGHDHSVPPHRINYRANIWALREVGAAAILATAVSGGIRADMLPGDLVLIDQFIDVTTGRAGTFYDEVGNLRHTDVSEPYDPDLRSRLAEAARHAGTEVHPSGTYICTNGPRFETPAEIRAYRAWGADLVGMTGCPEVALACELGIPYASVGVISNPAAGLADRPITIDEIMTTIDTASARLLGLFEAVSTSWPAAP